MRGSRAHVRYNALALRPGGSGVQTYIRELLSAVAEGWPSLELSALVQNDAVAELPTAVRPIVRPVTSGAVRAVLGLVPMTNADLVHGLDVDLPLASRGLRVATVHDLSVVDVPWAFSTLRSWGEKKLVRRTLQSADVLLSVSDFTAERVHALSGRQSIITHLAPAPWARPPTSEDVERVRGRWNLPDRFVLQVGTVEPRKDVNLLADACRSAGLPLVLAGAGSKRTLGLAGVVGLGYVDVADLPALYAAATVVAYCSLYEGFGLPPVEAMACGAAVVASAVGALPQIVKDGAVLVAGHHVTYWSAALREVAFDNQYAAHLRSRAPHVSSRLSWRATAEMTIMAYQNSGVTL